MRLEFDSVEEVLAFADRIKHESRPAPDPLMLAIDLARVGKEGNKIAAIKIYRAVFGTDLKESKEAICRVWP